MRLKPLIHAKENRFDGSKRDGVIDNFRALCMTSYLFSAVALYFLAVLPVWLPHWAGIDGNGIPFFSIGLFDFGPVMFFFLMGLTAVPAYRKSVRRIGVAKACVRLLHRNVIILAVAAISVLFANLVFRWGMDWSFFASIGVVGLLLIPFLGFGSVWRLAAGVLILITYQVAHVPLFALIGGGVGLASFGGGAACFGFLGVTLLVTVLADLRYTSPRYYAAATAVLMLCAVLSAKILPIRFEEFNVSYLLSTTAAFAAAFGAAMLLNRPLRNKPVPVFAAVGRSMIFFLGLSVLLGTLFGALFPSTLPFLALSLFISYLIFFAIAYIFERFKLTIKL
ncbi:MAG: hypothetical protein FWD58_09755 [Firmicutes bacterium]|nr:hypothetical protein [Bacillota bacterium]